MYIFGTALIVAAIAATLVSAFCYVRVIAGQNMLLRWARIGAGTALLCAVGSAVLLLVLFLLQRYDIRYVYDYSSQDLELRYRIAAVWAGQPGSLIVWALVGLICAPFLMGRTRHFEPYVLSLLMMLQAILLVFMLIRNPFAQTILNGVVSNPPDGRGLNPQLHNVWMVIHPPTLFTGYGLLGVPFCMALAGLWRRDYDGWARLALPWTVAGWTILGLALTMGGYWAYESLGWGGYWGWDPVESAALVPWLAGAALTHGLLLQRTHGGLRRTNIVLTIMTYGFVFFASFLTRSGVLGNFSVHSFVEEGLKSVMLGTMVTILAFAIGVFVLRWRDIPSRPLSQTVLSRHTFFVLMILTFAVLSVVMAVGTSLPWVTSFPNVGHSLQRAFDGIFELDDGTRFTGGAPFADGRFSLTPEFYKSTSSPLALVLAILMSVGPMLGWRGSDGRKLVVWLRWPFALTVVVTAIAIVIGVRDPLSIAFVLFSTLAVGTNTLMILRTLRSGWLRIGGYLAHVGVGVLLVGVVGSYAYSSPEHQIVIPQGETQSIFGHTFTFWGYEASPDGKHVLRLEIDKDTKSPFVARPDVYFNERMGAWVRTPAIKRYLFEDLYISPEDFVSVNDPNIALLGVNDEATVGPYKLHFDKFVLPEHMPTSAEASNTPVTVGASITITNGTTVRQLTPLLDVTMDGMMIPRPIPIGDGHQLLLQQVSVNSSQVMMRVTGLNLPVVPARAVLAISTKPAIALVWLGTTLIVLGGAVSVIRRRLELAGGTLPLSRRSRQASRPQSGRAGLPVPAWRALFQSRTALDPPSRQ